ncbi:3-isopropylmalate/(R)-2-methylmalate dehydratase small subunit [Haloferula luteola]|uniref:3-isopropylmalate dehydratase n=1 Tax=Haloferula luteola TaxID=595692 RepID=A0A840V7T0_9BACT|nr:3-isopropylmalate dehydratase small subunit [Haloferula luteola]MBB5351644.1 3-isopropylmalate/(R)-2-methylmalate dehydratase small subunit [Haloferula luteola]
MALDKITQVTGRGVFVPGADIDTDRIIPARFMKCVTFDGLGEFAFYDVRFDPTTGEKTQHPLNDERFAKATVLLAGVNFGCGSSREHAPQSLRKYGFTAVIAESFAEIFFGNSTTLGMPCVTLSHDAIAELRAAVEADPATEITIDLEAKKVRSGVGHEFDLAIPESARDALVSGRWDPIQELIDHTPQIEATAEKLHYV